MPRTRRFSKCLFALSLFAIALLFLTITPRLTRYEPALKKSHRETPALVAPLHNGAKIPPSTDAPLQAAPLPEADEAARRRIGEAYGQLPISFEANEGQFDTEVKYFARANGMSLFLTPTEAVLSLRQEKPRAQKTLRTRGGKVQRAKSRTDVLRMQLVGASGDASVEGLDEAAGKSNYFVGNNTANWRTNVARYARVRYGNVYPGIDLVYYGNQRQLEYDLVVAPGAAPGAIKLAFDGARRMYVDADGALCLGMSGGELRQPKPFIYQEQNGERKEIQGRYVINEKREVGFEVAAYDEGLPLVIDPTISYSTYLGGNRDDVGFDIALDSLGNAYITGATDSDNFPSLNSLPHASGGKYTFITKLNVAGTALVYSTYVGGTGGSFNDHANSIAVDRSGNAYVTGWTSKPDFPTVNAYQSVRRGGSDAFVTKLDASGAALVYSTYLGGSVGGSGIGGGEEGRGIAVDGAGNAYVVGRTESTDFPTLNAPQPQHGGGTCDNSHCNDAFVTKFDPSGASLVYSTYLGGNKIEYGNGITLDASGSAFVTGFTASHNFPTTVGVRQPAHSAAGTNSPDHDAFVAKLTPAGTSFVYSTYLGGFGGSSDGNGIAVDSGGNAYVAGGTNSALFPTVNAFQPAIGPGGPGTGAHFSDAFISKLNPAGTALVYSTFLGGTNSEEASAVAVDAGGHAYAVGSTNSRNFPVANAIQPNPGSPVDFAQSGDAFITKINPAGSSLGYSTFLGGSGYETVRGVAIDSAGNAYLTGNTSSANFPTLNPPQATYNGGLSYGDAFVTKIAETTAPASLSLSALQPDRGSNTGFVTVTLHGTAFANGATVKLVAAGQPDISATIAKVNQSGTVARARFNLDGQAMGKRDVVIVNPDNTSSTRVAAFNIEAGGAPQIWVDILGRSALRPSQSQTYYIAYGNRGNVDVALLPIFIAMSKNAEYELGFKMKPPRQPVHGKNYDFSQIPLHYETDTEKVIPLLIGFVPAGHSNLLKITITSHDRQPVLLSIRASEPKLFPEGFTPPASPSVTHAALSARNEANGTTSSQALEDFNSVVGCMFKVAGEVAENVLGILPAIDCLDAGLEYLGLGTVDVIYVGIDIHMGDPPGDYEAILPVMQEIFGGSAILAECADKEIPGLANIAAGIGIYLSLQTIAEDTDCGRTWQIASKVGKTIIALASNDPNDKFGASGVGAARHTSGSEPLHYAIFFENKADANAPAQEVVITDQLDPAKLDFDTFSLGPIFFGADKKVIPPSGLSDYAADVDLRPQQNLIVRVEARLDKATGLLTWRFTSLDPVTGLPTDDPLAGFLPPNRNAPEGEGQVLFTVGLKSGLPTGTEIRNKARIVFDTNAPIETAEWLNTLDNSRPTSKVSQLSAEQSALSFNVNWSGEDTGSGIRDYTIYVSQKGGPYTAWLTDTAATSGVFTGQPGTTYSFLAIASDKAGNVEPDKSLAEATTVIRLQTSISNVSGGGAYNETATLTATLAAGGSRLPDHTVTFTLNGAEVGTADTDAGGVATLTGVSLSGINAGTYPGVVGALFAGGASFTDTSGAGPLTVGRANQTINFGALTGKNFGDPDFALGATASSGLPVSFTAVGSCAVAGSTVRIAGAGSCTITATQAGDGSFNAAPNVQRSFQIEKAATTTVVSTSANPAAAGQSITFTATVSSAAGPPSGVVQFKVDDADFGAPAALGAGGSASLTTSALTSGTHIVIAIYSGDANFISSNGALANGLVVGSVFEFSQSLYTVAERGGSISISVRRVGHTAGAASVDFVTDDGSVPSMPVPCSSTMGLALERCDYTRAVGTLRFAPNETEQSFTVLVNDDSYAEGAETLQLVLSNPRGGVATGAVTLQITDDAPESTGNPVSDTAFFVRQHYLDFFSREPDSPGLAFWKGQLDECEQRPEAEREGCRDLRHVHVSAAFFLSIEFQDTGFLVYRAHQVAFNTGERLPLETFLADAQEIGRGVIVGQGDWKAQLEANELAFFDSFVARPTFLTQYPLTMTAAQYVDALNANTGRSLTQAERDELVNRLGSGQLTRAGVLRAVTTNAAFRRTQLDRAFVYMQYVGYLRRAPDQAGFDFWLQKLKNHNGDFVSAQMVRSFLVSGEYKERFGHP
jgi:hypothetical protein